MQLRQALEDIAYIMPGFSQFIKLNKMMLRIDWTLSMKLDKFDSFKHLQSIALQYART